MAKRHGHRHVPGSRLPQEHALSNALPQQLVSTELTETEQAKESKYIKQIKAYFILDL